VSLSCCTAGLDCVNTLLFELLYCAVVQSPPLGPIRRQSFQFCIVNIASFQVHTKLVFEPFSLTAWVSFGVRQLAIEHALGYTFIRNM